MPVQESKFHAAYQPSFAPPRGGIRAVLVRLLSLLEAADLEAAAARARARRRRKRRRPAHVPAYLRRDLGLPPEIEVPRHWDIR